MSPRRVHFILQLKTANIKTHTVDIHKFTLSEMSPRHVHFILQLKTANIKTHTVDIHKFTLSEMSLRHVHFILLLKTANIKTHIVDIHKFTLSEMSLLLLLSWCLMSSDVIWHIRDKLWPMPKHGSIRMVYACLAVTCHLHFWQNDRDFLRATVVTRGWNGYRNKSQHRKSTLEKKILPPFQQGFEPATFQSRVRRSNHWAIPAPWNEP